MLVVVRKRVFVSERGPIITVLCTGFNGVGTCMHEDVFLLERHPHFRGCYIQASMELGAEDVSL